MRFYFAYIFLLIYVIAALTFWWFSLVKLSTKITEQEVQILKTNIDPGRQPILYEEALNIIQEKEKNRTAQYAGEGITFLLITLIGAAIVYSSYRRNIHLSRQQNHFMLAVTHELKSPLAGIKLGLETIQKRKLTPEQSDTVMQRTLQEADRLNELCTNILVVSQMEGRHYKSLMEDMNFSDFIRRESQNFKDRYPQRIIAQIEDDINVSADQLLIQLAFSNLVENALKYSPKEKPVEIILTKEKNRALLKIIDEGKGIPDHLKSNVFKKFYRLEPEETRRTKGTGLGVYLSKKIVKQHKGHIVLQDNTPSGCVFVLSIPIIAPA